MAVMYFILGILLNSLHSKTYWCWALHSPHLLNRSMNSLSIFILFMIKKIS